MEHPSATERDESEAPHSSSCSHPQLPQQFEQVSETQQNATEQAIRSAKHSRSVAKQTLAAYHLLEEQATLEHHIFLKMAESLQIERAKSARLQEAAWQAQQEAAQMKQVLQARVQPVTPVAQARWTGIFLTGERRRRRLQKVEGGRAPRARPEAMPPPLPLLAPVHRPPPPWQGA